MKALTPSFILVTVFLAVCAKAQTDAALSTARRCVTPSSPLAMEATCLHSALDSACSKDNWPAHCTTLMTFNQKAQFLLYRVSHGNLAEDDALQQLAELIAPDQKPSAGDLPPEPKQDQTSIEKPPVVDWKHGIEDLPAGGWKFLLESADEDMMLFASTHNIAQVGSVIRVWFRHEYRDSQQTPLGGYMSSVSREEIDCTRQSMRTVAASKYQRNNLSGVLTTDTYDGKNSAWSPVVPGTMGEFMTQWACSKFKTRRQGSPTAESR